MSAGTALTGRLVRLRAREFDDAEDYHRWFNDPQVTTWLAVRYPVSLRRERQILEAAGAVGFERAAFSVESLGDGSLVGNCELQCQVESRAGTIGIAM